MHLVYAYFDFTENGKYPEGYRGYKECELNFGRECTYHMERHEWDYVLTRKERPENQRIAPDFWDADGRIYNVSALVGDNGAGKSTLIHELISAICAGIPMYANAGVQRWSLLIYEKQKDSRVSRYYRCEKQMASATYHKKDDTSAPISDVIPEVPVEMLDHTKLVYFSNTMSMADKTQYATYVGPKLSEASIYKLPLYDCSLVANMAHAMDSSGVSQQDLADFLDTFAEFQSYQQVRFVFDVKQRAIINALRDDGYPMPLPREMTISVHNAAERMDKLARKVVDVFDSERREREPVGFNDQRNFLSNRIETIGFMEFTAIRKRMRTAFFNAGSPQGKFPEKQTFLIELSLHCVISQLENAFPPLDRYNYWTALRDRSSDGSSDSEMGLATLCRYLFLCDAVRQEMIRLLETANKLDDFRNGILNLLDAIGYYGRDTDLDKRILEAMDPWGIHAEIISRVLIDPEQKGDSDTHGEGSSDAHGDSVYHRYIHYLWDEKNGAGQDVFDRYFKPINSVNQEESGNLWDENETNQEETGSPTQFRVALDRVIPQELNDYISLFVHNTRAILGRNSYFVDYTWGLSSGENNLLNMFTKLRYLLGYASDERMHEVYPSADHIIGNEPSTGNPGSLENTGDLPCDSVILFLDEADLTYHPEWQRQFVSVVTAYVSKLYDNCGIRDIQIILATHSPLMLGDFPEGCVTYLRKDPETGKITVRNGGVNTFGQNLYAILKQGFFLNNGAIGTLAQRKLNRVLEDTTRLRKEYEARAEALKNRARSDGKQAQKPEKADPAWAKKWLDALEKDERQVLRYLPDGILRGKLADELDHCRQLLETTASLDGQIERLKQQLAALEAKKQAVEEGDAW